MVSRPYAFLFNADAPPLGYDYGSPISQAFYRGLLTSDSERTTKTGVRNGDLVVHDLSYRVTELRPTQYGNGSGEVQSDDVKLRLTVIWDFCESATTAWCSFDPEELTLTIARSNIVAIVASDLERDVALGVDAAAWEHPFYLGAMEIDPGNPLQTHLLFSLLIYDEFYDHGNLKFIPDVLVPREELYELNGGDEWWADLPFTSITWHDASTDEPPPTFEKLPLSDRGKQSDALLKGRVLPTHPERVARALREQSLAQGKTWTWTIPRVPRATQAETDPAKLRDYVLNPEHPTGAHKALLFARVLEIARSDWPFLAYQLRFLLPRSRVVNKARIGDHGVQYHVDIPITGLNGAIRPVRTAWIIEPDRGQPRLVTAFLAPEDVTLDDLADPVSVPLLSPPVSQSGDWKQLFDLARSSALEAAEEMTPTPMVVSGEVIPEGEFGSAWVRIPDGRTRFARWVRKNNLGSHAHPRGIAIFAPYSFLQRSEVYANTFAEILLLNGIDCDIQTWLN